MAFVTSSVLVKNTFIDLVTNDFGLSLRRQASDSDLHRPRVQPFEPLTSQLWQLPVKCRWADCSQATDAPDSLSESLRSEGADTGFILPRMAAMTPKPVQHQESAKLPAGTTTVMMLRLPSSWLQQDVANWLDTCFADTYDFLYAPLGEVSQRGRGFAFINFKTAEAAASFQATFDGQHVGGMGMTGTTVSVCAARVQGYQANVDNLAKRECSRAAEST